jgi:hypothetical protein
MVAIDDLWDGRGVRLAGLPDFNATDARFRITGWEGIFATPVPDAQYAASGGGAGAIASGSWLPKERPMVLSGYVEDELALLPGYARALVAALPATYEASIGILANGRDDLDLQIFVRRYDKADLPISSRLDFQIPILALDPYLYALEPLTAGMAAWSGSFWYEAYSKPSSAWVKTYLKPSTAWGNTYSNVVPPGPYPDAAGLTPTSGGVASRRLIFTVGGPLTAGNWRLTQEDTGREMWVQASLTSGQSLTIDVAAETVTMAGEDLTSYLYGDMLTLEPAGSTYRLNVPTPNAEAYAIVSALPAYEI